MARTNVHDTLTGKFVSKLRALLDPKGTVEIAVKPQLTKEEITYTISALEAQAGNKRNEKLRSAVLGKLVRMLG